MPKNWTAITTLLASVLLGFSDISDAISDSSTCSAPAAQENLQDIFEDQDDADIVLQMQTRVFLDPQLTDVSKAPEPAKGEANIPKPLPGKDLLDNAQAVTAAESILREGLREAVSDLRGEWQQRLEKLQEREQEAEHGQDAFGPLLEFRGIGSAPPSMVVKTMKSHALEHDFLQMWGATTPSALYRVLGVIFIILLVRKLLYVWNLRNNRSQVGASLEAETNASAKLGQLLATLGFDPAVEEEVRIDLETKNKPPAETPVSDSEEEPEAECSVETTVKAWFHKMSVDSGGDQAQSAVIAADTDTPVAAADMQNLADVDSLA